MNSKKAENETREKKIRFVRLRSGQSLKAHGRLKLNPPIFLMVATPLVIHAGVVHLLWVSFFRRGVNLHSVEFKFTMTFLKFKISSDFRRHHVSDLGPRSGDFWPKWDQNFQLPQYALSQGALFNVAATNTGLHDKTTYSRLIANLHVQTLTVFFCWELFYCSFA